MYVIIIFQYLILFLVKKYLKKYTLYIIIEMLFNDNKCECCNNKKNVINFTLYNLLPANLCSKISEYDVYCNQCCITRDLEKFFVEENKDKGYTKFQVQLKFFMRYQKRFPVCFYHKIARKSSEKEIDEFLIIKRFD